MAKLSLFRLTSLAAAMFSMPSLAAAGSFESFQLGTVNLQQGWTTQDTWGNNVGSQYDQAIQDNNNGFRVWRMSNAYANSQISRQPFSPATAQVAGEAGSSLWNDYGPSNISPFDPPHYGANATITTFYTRVNFTSATGLPQPNLVLGLSLSAKQSTVRMTYIQLQDNGAGVDIVYVQPYVPNALIASGLSYTAVHSLETATYFKDGPDNDVVNVFLNGTLIHTGGTWEAYYYVTEQIVAGQPRLQAVNSLVVLSRGTLQPSYNGSGFYFTEIDVSTVIPTTVPVVTPTPVGVDVVVDFDLTGGGSGGTSGSIEFAEVTSTGIMIITAVDTAAGEMSPVYVPPTNFALGEPPVYIDIFTNATYSPPVVVCLSYAAGAFSGNVEPRMFHFTDNQWMDVTTSVDTVARVVCGQVQSLSPFALGYLIVTPNALTVKHLRLSNRPSHRTNHDGSQNDAWTFSGMLGATNVTATPLLLEAMDGNGVVFELYGRQGLINSVAFAGEDCRRIENASSSKTLSCSIKHGQTATTARATFKQHKHDNRLLVNAKFLRCAFDITASLKSLTPFEVRIITPTSLGALDSGVLRCKASSSRVRCVAA